MPAYKYNKPDELFKQLSKETAKGFFHFFVTPCKSAEINPELFTAMSGKIDSYGNRSALYAAISAKNEEVALHILEKLKEENPEYLEKIINLSVKGDEAGSTPLHTAIWRDMPIVAAELFRNGADLNVKNKHGETPLDNARQKKWTSNDFTRAVHEKDMEGKMEVEEESAQTPTAQHF
jgi:hypothetical protein